MVFECAVPSSSRVPPTEFLRVPRPRVPRPSSSTSSSSSCPEFLSRVPRNGTPVLQESSGKPPRLVSAASWLRCRRVFHASGTARKKERALMYTLFVRDLIGHKWLREGDAAHIAKKCGFLIPAA